MADIKALSTYRLTYLPFCATHASQKTMRLVTGERTGAPPPPGTFINTEEAGDLAQTAVEHTF